jgi:signal transduction histidine kinase
MFAVRMRDDASGITDLAKPRNTVESFFARASVRWLALSLISAAIIGTAVHNYRDIDTELTAVALARREAVAQLMAATLAEKFGRVVDVAISLSTRVRFRDLVTQGKWVEAIEIMRSVPQDLPQIERLFLADVTGTLKADVPELPGARGTNFAYREWFQGVSRDWRPYVSPVYTRAAPPRLNVFAVVVPIRNAAGHAVGILVLQIRVESLLQWVETIGIGSEEFIYLVDSKGQLAFHSKHRNQEKIVSLAGTPIVEKLRRGERGVETGFDPAEREDSIIAYAAVPGYGWGVVAQQPTRSSLALAARDEQLRRLLIGYGFILLLCAASIFLASRIAIARKHAEEDRRMKTELERRVAERTHQLDAANKELEAFSYSVSHDLRAPLRSIDGFGQALLEDCASRLDDQGRHYLQRIRGSTQHMGQLIDDLLKLSRATRAEIRREPVDLTQMAQTVTAELRRAEPGRQVELQVQDGMIANGDLRLLRIVLENLLSNAWKFTSRVEHPRIEMSSFQDGAGQHTYYVRDNGVGFDMAYIDKLFGAFQRLHSPADFPGTGIGLATVQRIIHRHGGRVWAESEVGKGASFYFTLGPFSQPSPLENPS